MRIIHGTDCFHTTRVICISTQKIQSWTTPNFMKQGDKEIKTKSLSIFTHHFSPCPSVTSNDNSGVRISHSFRVSHIHDHNWKSAAFSRVFQWQTDFHEEFSFKLWKSSIYSTFILWLLCTNVERFGREKIVQIFSAILNLVTCPASV